jgi:uncharacterized RDD family membrane protein YckC
MKRAYSGRQLFASFCLAAGIMLLLTVLARAQTAAEAPAPSESAAPQKTDVPVASETAAAAEPAPEVPAPRGTLDGESAAFDLRRTGREIHSVGEDAVLPKGEQADEVVAVLGSALAHGDVAGRIVSVLGDARADGVTGGEVVAVLGNAQVNGHVRRKVVAVFGDVVLGPNADVEGKVVAVGGSVVRDSRARLRGGVSIPFAVGHPKLDGLREWLRRCALWGRPLAFGPDLGWAWAVAGGFLVFYLLLALGFRGGIGRCAETLEQRPGRTIIAAVLAVLLAPVVVVLLAITGVGVVIIPFLLASFFVAALFGRAVVLVWLGRRFTGLCFKAAPLHPIVDLLAGAIIVAALYLVPLLGLLVWKAIGVIGFGVVIYTILLGTSRGRSAATFAAPSPRPVPEPVTADFAPLTGTSLIGGSPGATAPSVQPSPGKMPATEPIVAGFWIRVLALLIDIMLVGTVCSILRVPKPSLVVVLAAYGAVMWVLRGTTVGGIVCDLKVVRVDRRPLDWPTAVVRALGCFLSMTVVFLGFIWIAFDDEKRSWHDKIAGTAVVRLPKGSARL